MANFANDKCTVHPCIMQGLSFCTVRLSHEVGESHHVHYSTRYACTCVMVLGSHSTGLHIVSYGWVQANTPGNDDYCQAPFISLSTNVSEYFFCRRNFLPNIFLLTLQPYTVAGSNRRVVDGDVVVVAVSLVVCFAYLIRFATIHL